MSYIKEQDLANEIDCYWSSTDKALYPSLPEPYINLFFSINSDKPPLIKGISSISDYLDVNTELFGVRLSLKGFYQLNITECHQTVNKTQSLLGIGGEDEKTVASSIEKANNFEERVQAFKEYYLVKKQNHSLSKLQLNITNAFGFFISNYNDEGVIGNCASVLSVSPRTVHRWFVNNIGINPKRMSRIVRFHHAVHHLLSHEKNFYYDLGYFDQAHFIKEFKEFTGKSPEEFLKLLSEIYNT